MRTRWPAVFVAVVVGAFACKKTPTAEPPPVRPLDEPIESQPAPSLVSERVVLAEVAILEVDVEPGVDILATQLAKALGRRLIASGAYYSSTDDVPGPFRARRAALEVRVGHLVVDEADHGGAAQLASADARLMWLDPGVEVEVGERVLVEQPVKGSIGPGDVATHVARAVDAVAPGLIAKERLLRAPDEDVIAALSSKDGDQVEWALRILDARRLRPSATLLTPLLADKRSAVSDAAFSAMVALRDPALLKHLTGRVNFADYDALRQIVEAAVVIGGPEAEAFLEFVASGHPEPSIVDRAEEGLREVRKRRVAKAAAP